MGRRAGLLGSSGGDGGGSGSSSGGTGGTGGTGGSIRSEGSLVRTCRGQSTVEAAVCIPILFLVLCMMLQPAIVLYDRMVMNAAAAEGCRLLATRSAQAGLDDARCVVMVKRHLGAVPSVPIFHVHEPACTWDVHVEGDEASPQVLVRISTKVRLLPFVDAVSTAVGLAGPDGCMDLAVECSQDTQPAWAGTPDPVGWVAQRL